MSSLASALKLENVVYDKKGPIAYVTLNRPKVMNALNKSTINELRSAFEDARDDSDVRGVILTGAGEKAFVAGADISEFISLGAAEGAALAKKGQDGVWRGTATKDGQSGSVSVDYQGNVN